MTNEELSIKLRRVGERALSKNMQELLDQAADALEESNAVIEAVKQARGHHPVCKRHPVGDFLECGWKTTVLDIDAALAKGEIK